LTVEVRHWRATGIEVRAQSSTDLIKITGQPIVFGTPYPVQDAFGEFTETMAPGVAKDVLRRGVDCRFLFNHTGLPLARTSSGTLTLSETSSALEFEAVLDARQQLSNDLGIAIERGDVNQMSCAFTVGKDSWDGREENRVIYSLAALRDVSAVTYPCSPSTSLEIAQRMALEMPVESRARLRRLYAQIRAGTPLSAKDREHMALMVGLAEVRDPARSPSGVRMGANLRRELAEIERSKPRPEGHLRAVPRSIPRRAPTSTPLVKAEDLRRAADEIKHKRRELAA